MMRVWLSTHTPDNIDGSRPLSAATPLLVQDVLDLFESYGARVSKKSMGAFIKKMLSNSTLPCDTDDDKLHYLYEKISGKGSTLKRIKERIRSNHGLGSTTYTDFCMMPFWPPATWKTAYGAQQAGLGGRKRRRKKAPQSASELGGGDGASYAQRLEQRLEQLCEELVPQMEEPSTLPIKGSVMSFSRT